MMRSRGVCTMRLRLSVAPHENRRIYGILLLKDRNETIIERMMSKGSRASEKF